MHDDNAREETIRTEHPNVPVAPDTITLARLKDLSDFEIADGQPDIRGWKVRTADAGEIGEVESLIADPKALEVRYLEVRVRKELLGSNDDENVLIPIGVVQLHEEDDVVVLRMLPSGGLRGVPRFGQEAPRDEYDQALRTYYGVSSVSSRDEQARFFGTRRGRRDQRSNKG